MSKRKVAIVLVVSVFLAGFPAQSAESKRKRAKLWLAPSSIASRNLFYGPGGRSHAPGPGPYEFVEEDPGGTNPKFVVQDAGGVKWKVKVGNEARPEVAATRLIWAIGYFADEDYFVPSMRIRNMPPKLRRGSEFASKDGMVRNGRWERLGTERVARWDWSDNQFDDTRELNGLRVMMALINNWDVKTDQNAVYEGVQERKYVVADVGTSFGQTGTRWPIPTKKGDVEEYARSGFIVKTTDRYVDFATPAWARLFGIVPLPPVPYPWITAPVRLYGGTPAPDIGARWWVGKRIPIEDVRWVAGLLRQLTAKQIRDAFRAAHYSPAEVEAFSRVVQSRIAELNEI